SSLCGRSLCSLIFACISASCERSCASVALYRSSAWDHRRSLEEAEGEEEAEAEDAAEEEEEEERASAPRRCEFSDWSWSSCCCSACMRPPCLAADASPPCCCCSSS